MYETRVRGYVTPELATRLDDKFLSAQPQNYFRARLATLLAHDSVTNEPRSAIHDKLTLLLGDAVAFVAGVDSRARETQTAIDAFLLRHHVAECLVRLIHAMLRPGATTSGSVWVDLCDTPPQTNDVIADVRSIFDRDSDGGVARLGQLLLPRWVQGGDVPNLGGSALEEARALHVAWVEFAIVLLTQKVPDLTAAHNKMKHGAALRIRDDLLARFAQTGPREDGTIPLSAFEGPDAVDVFDGIHLEWLARASRRSGLESTQLVLDPAPTLLEAALLTQTYAMLFWTAAQSHFADDSETSFVIPHPGIFVQGPLPGLGRDRQLLGMRFPLTSPYRAGGSEVPLLIWQNGNLQEFTVGAPLSAMVSQY